MNNHEVVAHEDWIAARKALLAKEREFTRLRDELGREIRALPWERVATGYVFQGPAGPLGLADLFAGKSQLLVYHFMFDPDWEIGCKSCSLIADHFDPLAVHLAARDVALAAVSRAPIAKLQAFQARLGWRFPWVSSAANDFNRDYGVSFTPEEIAQGAVTYNYRPGGPPMTELPGLSVFAKEADGSLFHTYSTYARGLETFLGVYRYLDVVPKGRDEAGLGYGMEWVRLRDEYGG